MRASVDVFGWLRRRDKVASAIVLRERDCHCHAIPGVDDGSRDMDMSLAMLRLLHAAGACTIVCTSHMYPGKYDNTPDGLRRVFESLERARSDARIPVALELGAEHFLDDDFPVRIAAGQIIAFGAERYVLFETPTGEHVPSALWPSVRALTSRGYVPLLAHVERYHWLRGEDGDELCEDLRAAGVRFQCNRTVGKANVPGEGQRGHFLAKLLERGWIDEVGSDLHRATEEGRPF
jgi:protein-tyrosine phosphatase